MQEPDRLRQEYFARVNRAIDHIETHLGEELSLAEIARVAAFSPFHFHRIFGALMGETLSQFIARLRLERAATQLLGHPEASIMEIGLDAGFSGPAAFARAFKARFGMSASEWRNGRGESKLGKADRDSGELLRKLRQELQIETSYTRGGTQTWRITMKKDGTLKADVEVKELPERTVAYVRHVGPYAGNAELFADLFTRLCRWAGPRGLLGRPDALMLTVYHDNPEVTDDSKLRTSVCVAVPEDTQVSGEVGKMAVSGGKYAIGRFEARSDGFAAAWNTLYGAWLPESGYEPDDRPPFEVCHNDPKDHPEGKFIFDVCIPVRPV